MNRDGQLCVRIFWANPSVLMVPELGDICSDLPGERNEEEEWEYGYFE